VMLNVTILTHDPAPERAWRTVVGVVSDVRYRGIDDVRLDVYDALAQARMEARDVVVRGRGDARRLISAVQAEARHEFALRIALGASADKVVRSVLVSIATRIIPGLLLGIIASAAGTQTLRALLFGVQVLDAVTYAVVVLLITCVTVLAAYVPARRAALVDPLTLFSRG
jgi:hypothetical protein